MNSKRAKNIRKNGVVEFEGRADATDATETEDREEMERRQKKLKDSIYATSIAKVVVKRGRLTIPPEIVLERSGLLPPRPGDEAKPAASGDMDTNSGMEMANGSVNVNADAKVDGSATAASTATATATATADANASEPWTWQKMEARRQQGLELAAKFAELDAAQALFDGGREGALGEYADLFWA